MMKIHFFPMWEDSHCANCGKEDRDLFGGWCIDCAGPVDYPWYCAECDDYVHVEEAIAGRCPECGTELWDTREEA